MDIKSSLELVTISFSCSKDLIFRELAFTIKSFNCSSLLKALEFSRICPTYGINDNSILKPKASSGTSCDSSLLKKSFT